MGAARCWSGLKFALVLVLVCTALGAWVEAAEASSRNLGGHPSSSGPHVGYFTDNAAADGSVLSSWLVTPGSPMEDEQLRAQEEADRRSPAGVAIQRASTRRFARLGAGAAAAVDDEAFAGAVTEPDGGPPALPADEKIIGFRSPTVASVAVGRLGRGVIQSGQALAVKSPQGGLTSLDLSLRSTRAGFQAKTPLVPVELPKRASEGFALSQLGIGLIPVNSRRQPLSGSSGAIDGASVLYANTATDADIIAKATTYGLRADTILRSQASPETLFYRLVLPTGVTVKQRGGGSGMIEVLRGAAVIASIPAPSAIDATGRTVPVKMHLSGDLLRLVVSRPVGEYVYPLLVDPTVIQFSGASCPSSWLFYNAEGPQFECATIWGLRTKESNKEAYRAGEFAYLYFLTKGVSQIYSAKVTEARFSGEPYFRASLYIASASGREGSTATIKDSFFPTSAETCTESGCAVPSEATVSSHKENGAFLQVSVAEPPSPESVETLESNQQVSIVQYASPTIAFDTTNPRIAESGPSSTEGGANPLYGGGQWIQSRARGESLENISEEPRLDITGTDPGIGVSGVEWKAPGTPGWEPYDGNAFFTGERRDTHCVVGGVECEPCIGYSCTVAEPETTALLGLPDGEDSIEARVLNATKAYASATAIVKVDSTPPENISLSGLPSSLEITNANDHQSRLSLTATATDGKTGTPSSGVASLSLIVDGKPVGTPSGSCAPGPCSATGTPWSLDTEELPTGPNTVAVEARDKAGNTSTKTYTLTVDAPTATTAGPASVNPITGEVGLEAQDVSVSAPGAPLTVSRSYHSRHLTAGAGGPLGPDWQFNVGGGASIELGSNEDAILTMADGNKTIFTPGPHGEYIPPRGDTTMRLKYYYPNEFTLNVDGAVTNFERVPGGSESLYMPVVSEGTSGTSATTFEYQTVEGVTEPVEAIAPTPAGVSCAPTLTKGCRALTFNYATSTTATGSAPSEWGDYKGRLTRVYFTAWNPSTGKKVVATVAQYAYDSTGRLRAEWNPEISPALKTTYGYDTTGHVTAVTPPGQQPWLLAYGTAQEDRNAGRLLALVRPSASTPFGNGTAPADTTAPSLSTNTPKVGEKISVSNNGNWANSPLSYSYQWQDCNSSGGECAVIEGAVNQSYYPVRSDEGHRLVAQVTALNGAGGTTTSTTATTAAVATGTPVNTPPAPPNPGSNAVWTFEYNVPVSGTGAPYPLGASEAANWGQHDDPETGTAMFPPDEPMGWPAQDYRRATIRYTDPHDRSVNVATPSGGISTSEYNEYNDIVRSLTPDNRASALAEGSHSAEASESLDTKTAYTNEGSEITSTTGPLHSIKLGNGSPVKARAIRRTYYDEGAPNGEHPGLPTKSTEAALVNGKEEATHTETIGYGGQNNLGWRLRKPTSRTIDPEGLDLVHTTLYDPNTGAVTETRSPASGKAGEEPGYGLTAAFGKLGSSAGQFKEPTGITFNPTGELLVVDSGNSRVQQFTRAGKQTHEFGAPGSEPGQLNAPQAIGLMGNTEAWIADTGNNRVEEMSTIGGKSSVILGTEITVEEQISHWHTWAPQGVATNNNHEIWIADTSNNRLIGYHRSGTRGKTYVYKYPSGMFSGYKFSSPTALAFGASEGILYVADTGNNQIVELKAPEGQYPEVVRTFNSAGTGAGQLKEPRGIAVDREGHVWVSDTGNNRLVEYTTEGVPIQTVGSAGTKEGQLKEPRGIAVGPENGIWVVDSGNDRIEAWTASGTGYEQPGKGHAHDTQIIYYTAEANAQNSKCGKKPIFAGLPCISQPTKQPEGSLLALPVSSYTYNMWDAVESTTEAFTAGERVTTNAYGAAGRLETSTLVASTGAPIAPVHYFYSELTGALDALESTIEGTVRKLSLESNALGQLTRYVDSDGNATSYSYDVDSRIEKLDDGKGTQKYAYDNTTGRLTSLTDSQVGVLTAGYDVEGNQTSETYPNGMTGSQSYSPTDQPIAREYVKATHCTTGCTWYSDQVVPGVTEQWGSQTATMGSEAYRYDAAGRLAETQETPTGAGCTTRLYGYDADTNLTELTTRAPATEGKCASSGGVTEKHTYDEADRLNDVGTAYNELNATTTLPAADAGGVPLNTGYYSDGQTESLTQGEASRKYRLDPAGRVRATEAAQATSISHYAGPDKTPAWVAEPGEAWTRYVSGISGELVAVAKSNGQPTFQLSDLHGDVVGAASSSETATKPEYLAEATTEYGVPRAGSTEHKLGWLGALGVSTEFATGVASTPARTYVPDLGRFLQMDPREGGSANAYAYTFGDPVNSADPSGEATEGMPPAWAIEEGRQHAAEAVEARAAELAAARAEAERKAAEANARWAAEKAALERSIEPSGAGVAWSSEPLGGSIAWEIQYALETGQWESATPLGQGASGARASAASAGCGYSCYKMHGSGGWGVCETASFFGIFLPIKLSFLKGAEYIVKVASGISMKVLCG